MLHDAISRKFVGYRASYERFTKIKPKWRFCRPCILLLLNTDDLRKITENIQRLDNG